jgi:peroxin-19
MLDEFSSTSVSASGPGRPAPALASTTTATQPVASNTVAEPSLPNEDQLGAEFSAQLQKEMAALLGEIEESPEMRKQLDELMGELTAGAEKVLREEDEKNGVVSLESGPSTIKGSSKDPKADAASTETFTDTIKRTMERMAASGEQASAAAAAGSNSEEDMLAALFKDLAAGGGDGSEEEFSKMLLGMMEQLTNKDVLYEPMKELDEKFPDWIQRNEGKIPTEEMSKYKEQRGFVREIVDRFERKDYSDDNPADREFIVESMQKVCRVTY